MKSGPMNITRAFSSEPWELDQMVHNTVDNVVTDWIIIVDGDQLQTEANELGAFSGGEKHQDLYIERLLVDFQGVANPASGNNTGVIPAWVGLAIIDRDVALKDDVPTGLVNAVFIDFVWRSSDNVSRILRAEPMLFTKGYGGIYDDTTESVPAGVVHPWFRRFDVKGQLHIKRSEAVVFVCSQTGVFDAWQPWTGDASDTLDIAGTVTALVRRKKGS